MESLEERATFIINGRFKYGKDAVKVSSMNAVIKKRCLTLTLQCPLELPAAQTKKEECKYVQKVGATTRFSCFYSVYI